MAACQQIGAFVYDEAKKEHPRAVLGYTDLAARANVGKTIPGNMFTFAVPFSLYRGNGGGGKRRGVRRPDLERACREKRNGGKS